VVVLSTLVALSQAQLVVVEEPVVVEELEGMVEAAFQENVDHLYDWIGRLGPWDHLRTISVNLKLDHQASGMKFTYDPNAAGKHYNVQTKWESTAVGMHVTFHGNGVIYGCRTFTGEGQILFVAVSNPFEGKIKTRVGYYSIEDATKNGHNCDTVMKQKTGWGNHEGYVFTTLKDWNHPLNPSTITYNLDYYGTKPITTMATDMHSPILNASEAMLAV